MSQTAILDACVLYPAPLRDLLLHLAVAGLFRARWTQLIHDEWIRNLVAAGFDPQRLQRTRSLMDRAVPDALISGFEPLIATLDLPDPDDRHVLAAAIAADADVIVTFNLADFPAAKLAPHGLKAEHPDEFVTHLIDPDPGVVCDAVKRQRAALRNPPYSVSEFLQALERNQLVHSVERLRPLSHLI